jgi:hypothetical protein
VAYIIVYNKADIQKSKNNQKKPGITISLKVFEQSKKKALTNFIIERVIT